MIKAVGTGRTGRPLVVLGLSDENWARLRAGRPILVELAELSPTLPALSVVLLGGDTEQSLMDDLRALGPLPGGPS